MRMKLATALALLSSLAMPLPLIAQTVTTYEAPTGSVSPSLGITMHLTGGGSAILNPAVGPDCYLGMTCPFSNSNASYTLPDGSTANLTNFSGTFFPFAGNSYEIAGQASGTDGAGRTVTVDNVQVTMTIICRSGRGGGCSKVYTGGIFTLTVDGCRSCQTMTPTVRPSTDTPTATPTSTETPRTTPTSTPIRAPSRRATPTRRTTRTRPATRTRTATPTHPATP